MNQNVCQRGPAVQLVFCGCSRGGAMMLDVTMPTAMRTQQNELALDDVQQGAD